MTLFFMVDVYCMMPDSHNFHKLLQDFFFWITFEKNNSRLMVQKSNPISQKRCH